MQQQQQSPAEIIARMRRNLPPCVQTLGGEVLEIDTERAWVKMRWLAKPEFCHSGNVVQGGFLTGMVDSCMAQAAMLRGGFQFAVPTLEIKVSFFSPGRPGVIVSEGWVERWGRSTAFLEGRLYREDGEAVVKATATIRLLPRAMATQ